MKSKIIVSLIPSPDHQDLFEVIDITSPLSCDGNNPSIPVLGLLDAKYLQVSSWVLKSELSKFLLCNPELRIEIIETLRMSPISDCVFLETLKKMKPADISKSFANLPVSLLRFRFSSETVNCIASLELPQETEQNVYDGSMKLQDWYELTLSGDPIESIPIPSEFLDIISKFKEFEGRPVSASEIHVQTGISLFYIRTLQKVHERFKSKKLHKPPLRFVKLLPEMREKRYRVTEHEIKGCGVCA